MNAQQQLERYLQQASRGLWGQEKTIVCEELRGNILLRAQELEAFGATPSEAMSKSLQELGGAELVATGMGRVYAIPRYLRFGGVVATLAASTMLIWHSGQAQVAALKRPVAVGCEASSQQPPLPRDFVVQKICKMDASHSWLKVSSLKSELRAQGIAVKDYSKGAGLSITLPEGNTVDVIPRFISRSTTTLTIEQDISSAQQVLLARIERFRQQKASPELIARLSEAATTLQVVGQQSKPADWLLLPDGPYVNTEVLVAALLEQGQVAVELSGWDNPSLRFGQSQITLGNSETPVNAQNLYSASLSSYWGQYPGKSAILPWFVGTIGSLGFNFSRQAATTGSIVITERMNTGKVLGTKEGAIGSSLRGVNDRSIQISINSTNSRPLYTHTIPVPSEGNQVYALVHQPNTINLGTPIQVSEPITASATGTISFTSPSERLTFTSHFNNQPDQNQGSKLMLLQLTGKLNNPFEVAKTIMPTVTESIGIKQ
jgi:hypothetical protein